MGKVDITLFIKHHKHEMLIVQIYIDDIMTYEGKYGIKTMSATFIGTIEEPYLNGFINFLNEQGVKVHKN